jgi:hypothetical protein
MTQHTTSEPKPTPKQLTKQLVAQSETLMQPLLVGGLKEAWTQVSDGLKMHSVSWAEIKDFYVKQQEPDSYDVHQRLTSPNIDTQGRVRALDSLHHVNKKFADEKLGGDEDLLQRAITFVKFQLEVEKAIDEIADGQECQKPLHAAIMNAEAFSGSLLSGKAVRDLAIQKFKTDVNREIAARSGGRHVG